MQAIRLLAAWAVPLLSLLRRLACPLVAPSRDCAVLPVKLVCSLFRELPSNAGYLGLICEGDATAFALSPGSFTSIASPLHNMPYVSTY